MGSIPSLAWRKWQCFQSSFSTQYSSLSAQDATCLTPSIPTSTPFKHLHASICLDLIQELFPLARIIPVPLLFPLQPQILPPKPLLSNAQHTRYIARNACIQDPRPNHPPRHMRDLCHEIILAELERLRGERRREQRRVGVQVREHVRHGRCGVQVEDQRSQGAGRGGGQREGQVGRVEDEEGFPRWSGRGGGQGGYGGCESGLQVCEVERGQGEVRWALAGGARLRWSWRGRGCAWCWMCGLRGRWWWASGGYGAAWWSSYRQYLSGCSRLVNLSRRSRRAQTCLGLLRLRRLRLLCLCILPITHNQPAQSIHKRKPLLSL